MSYLDSLIFGVRQIFVAGVQVFERSKLNFASGFTVVDNPITGATDVTASGGGGGGDLSSIIWRPGVASANNHVATWGEVAALIATTVATEVPLTVIVDPSVAVAIVTGAITNCARLVTFKAMPEQFWFSTTFTISDGATLHDVFAFDGVYVSMLTTGVPALSFSYPVPNGGVSILGMRGGASLENVGSAPACVIGAGETLYVDALIFSQLIIGQFLGAAGSELFDLSTATSSVVVSLRGDHNIQSDSISAVAGSSLSISYDTNLVSFTSEAFPTFANALGSVVFSPQGFPAHLASSAAKTADYAAHSGEFILVDATGGPITVTLPEFPNTGDAVTVKASILTANAITVDAFGAGTIDGVATDTISAATTLQSRSYVFSGSATWFTVSKVLDPGISAPGAVATEIITTDGAGNFQVAADVSADAGTLSLGDLALVAATGTVRMLTASTIKNRNSGDTDDLFAVQSDGADSLWIGGDTTRSDSNGFTNLNHLCRASGAHQFYVGETVRVVIDDNFVQVGKPIIGYASPYGATHSSAEENMGDADYEVVNYPYFMINVSAVTANTAIRKLKFPDVATATESYTKYVRNGNGGGFAVRVSVVTGGFATVDIADGFGAWVGFDATGVYRLGPDVAL